MLPMESVQPTAGYALYSRAELESAGPGSPAPPRWSSPQPTMLRATLLVALASASSASNVYIIEDGQCGQ
jgi:hypothetical protein